MSEETKVPDAATNSGATGTSPAPPKPPEQGDANKDPAKQGDANKDNKGKPPAPPGKPKVTTEDPPSQPPEPTVLDIVKTMGDKVADKSNWHFYVEAPGWTARTARTNQIVSSIAGAAAFALAVVASLLAWLALDKLTTPPSGTASPPLAVQIAPWAVVGALLVAAGVSARAAMNNSRLRLRLTQLNKGKTAAKALAASASDQASAHGPPGAAQNIETATDHAAAADKQAAAAVNAAGDNPDAAPAAASALASAAAAHASVAGAAAGGNSTANGASNGKDPATTVSPKVWAGSIAGAASASFWTIAAATFWKHSISSDSLAALVGSTTTLASATAAHIKRDPLRVKA